MSLFNFISNKKTEKSNFQTLYRLISIDRRPSDKELYLLNMFGNTYKLSSKTKQKIINGNEIEQSLPKSKIDKLQLLSDMCMLMCIKNYFSQSEYEYCVNICSLMNLKPTEVNEQIETIIENSSHLLNGAYDGNKLRKSYHEIVK